MGFGMSRVVVVVGVSERKGVGCGWYLERRQLFGTAREVVWTAWLCVCLYDNERLLVARAKVGLRSAQRQGVGRQVREKGVTTMYCSTFNSLISVDHVLPCPAGCELALPRGRVPTVEGRD